MAAFWLAPGVLLAQTGPLKGWKRSIPKAPRPAPAPPTDWSWSGGFLWFESPREVGLESFTFKYPDKQYPGHFKERGYNGINYLGAKDCWIRNIGFYKADLA